LSDSLQVNVRVSGELKKLGSIPCQWQLILSDYLQVDVHVSGELKKLAGSIPWRCQLPMVANIPDSLNVRVSGELKLEVRKHPMPVAADCYLIILEHLESSEHHLWAFKLQISPN
jgi:hypothetical protein